MTRVVYSYGPKPAYYKRIIKYDVNHFLREVRVRGDYDIFIDNLLKNFEGFYDEEVFPVEKYSANEIIENEDLLKKFLKRLFKTKI